jgi:hypothetical protein
VGLRTWSIKSGDQWFLFTVFKINVDKSGATNKHRMAVLYDTVSACTNVAVLFFTERASNVFSNVFPKTILSLHKIYFSSHTYLTFYGLVAEIRRQILK